MAEQGAEKKDKIKNTKTKRKKNGDAPGPLGDFVMSLVTERTKKKGKQTKKKEKEKTKQKPL